MMKNDNEDYEKNHRTDLFDESFSSDVNMSSDGSRSSSSSRRRVNVAFFIVPFFVVIVCATFFLRDCLREIHVPGDRQLPVSVEPNVSTAPTETSEPVPGTIASPTELESVPQMSDDDANFDDSIIETTDPPETEKSELKEPDASSAETLETSSTDESSEEPSEVDEQVKEEQLESLEQTKQALAQIDYEFSSLKQQDERDVDSLQARLIPLVEEAEKASKNAPEELVERSKKLAEELRTFQRCIECNADFLRNLYALDQASLTLEETRNFFAPYQDQTHTSEFAEITSYWKDFANVSKTLDALNATDRWNEFVKRNGDALERFYVQPEVAKLALDYLKQNQSAPGRPQEYWALERRKAEWEFDVAALVAVQRKILLKLEAEISQRYWTYAPTSDRCYYLPDRPRLGKNEYVANQDGTTLIVEIPETALELQSVESVQTDFLRSLAIRARLIPDELRTEDVAQWYEKWCAFLSELQETKKLDSIVKYVLFRDVVDILASSDYYFARRLEPLQRMLVTSQLDDVSIDRFQTDSSELQRLRRLANSKIDFLPKDYLTVDKTSAQLDALVERVAYSYQRIGWLDRDFSGVWRCRYLKERELPVGELFILRPEENSTTQQWLKIGESDGRQISLKLASANVPRGSIVLCRTRLVEQEQVAKRTGLDQYFRR